MERQEEQEEEEEEQTGREIEGREDFMEKEEEVMMEGQLNICSRSCVCLLFFHSYCAKEGVRGAVKWTWGIQWL